MEGESFRDCSEDNEESELTGRKTWFLIVGRCLRELGGTR